VPASPAAQASALLVEGRTPADYGFGVNQDDQLLITFTMDEDVRTLPPGSAKRHNYILTFKDDVAHALHVPAPRINIVSIAPSTEQRLDVNFIIWPARSKDDISTSKLLDTLFGQVRNHASPIYSGDATGALLFAKIGSTNQVIRAEDPAEIVKPALPTGAVIADFTTQHAHDILMDTLEGREFNDDLRHDLAVALNVEPARFQLAEAGRGRIVVFILPSSVASDSAPSALAASLKALVDDRSSRLYRGKITSDIHTMTTPDAVPDPHSFSDPVSVVAPVAPQASAPASVPAAATPPAAAAPANPALLAAAGLPGPAGPAPQKP